MIKTPLFTILLLLTTLAYAQTEKGSFTIGGSGNFSHQKNDGSDAKQLSLSLSPSAGYFIADRLAVGLSLPFMYSKVTTGGGITPTATTFGAGPFVRYYIPLSGDDLFLLTEGEFVLTRTSGKSGYFDLNLSDFVTYKTVTTQSRYRLGAGVAIFLNNHISVDILANYAHLSSDTDTPDNDFLGASTTKTSQVYISIGFRIFLPAKASE